MFLQTYCNIQTTPSWELVRLKQTCQSGSVSGLELISMGYLFEGGPSENTQYNPTIYSPQLASGETIYAMVFKPHNFALGVKYPTVLNVYGGPEVQTVSNTFKVSFTSFSLRIKFDVTSHFRACVSCGCTCWPPRDTAWCA